MKPERRKKPSTPIQPIERAGPSRATAGTYASAKAAKWKSSTRPAKRARTPVSAAIGGGLATASPARKRGDVVPQRVEPRARLARRDDGVRGQLARRRAV